MLKSFNLLESLIYKKKKPFTPATRSKYYKELTKMKLIYRPDNAKEYLPTGRAEILILLLKSDCLIDFINNAGEIANNGK